MAISAIIALTTKNAESTANGKGVEIDALILADGLP